MNIKMSEIFKSRFRQQKKISLWWLDIFLACLGILIMFCDSKKLFYSVPMFKKHSKKLYVGIGMYQAVHYSTY